MLILLLLFKESLNEFMNARYKTTRQEKTMKPLVNFCFILFFLLLLLHFWINTCFLFCCINEFRERQHTMCQKFTESNRLSLLMGKYNHNIHEIVTPKFIVFEIQKKFYQSFKMYSVFVMLSDILLGRWNNQHKQITHTYTHKQNRIYLISFYCSAFCLLLLLNNIFFVPWKNY